MADFFSTRECVLAFDGRYSDSVLNRHDVNATRLISDMSEKRLTMQQEIEAELFQELHTRQITVRLQFGEGSFEWLGEVNAVLGVLANVGGVIGLLQLVGTVISRVLKRHLPPRLPMPYTKVIMMYVSPQPDEALPRVTSGRRQFPFLEIFALSCASLNVMAIVVLSIIAARLASG